jgi:hypothetical protein
MRVTSRLTSEMLDRDLEVDAAAETATACVDGPRVEASHWRPYAEVDDDRTMRAQRGTSHDVRHVWSWQAKAEEGGAAGGEGVFGA